MAVTADISKVRHTKSRTEIRWWIRGGIFVLAIVWPVVSSWWQSGWPDCLCGISLWVLIISIVLGMVGIYLGDLALRRIIEITEWIHGKP